MFPDPPENWYFKGHMDSLHVFSLKNIDNVLQMLSFFGLCSEGNLSLNGFCYPSA